jgi:glutaminyl-tRNA synthetase
MNTHSLLSDELKQELRWADGANVKREVDMQILELLGPKTADDLAPKAKKKAPTESKPAKANVKPEVNGSVAVDETEGAESIDELLR